jgi:hypothetical protein
MRLPADVLVEIEEALAVPLFRGAPIGPTLSSLMQIELLTGKGRWDSLAIAADVARWVRHRLLPERRDREACSEQRVRDLKGRLLLTWLVDHPNFTNLVTPVIETLGVEGCVVIGSGDLPAGRLPPGAHLLRWSDLPRAEAGSWRRELRDCSESWYESLRTVLLERGISRRVLPRLFGNLFCQARRIVACQALLGLLEPRAVVTEYDRNPYSSCLVLAARASGIPTFTMLHGVIAGRYGYTPLVADRVFCWGERSRQALISLGVEGERVEPIGCQAVTRELAISKKEARARLALSDERAVALLATTPTRESVRRDLARHFADAFPPGSGVAPIIRLHPSDRLSVYDCEAGNLREVRFLPAAEHSIDVTLAAADVVVCHNTAFGLDALVKQVPVVILDSIDEPLTWGRELVDAAGCPRARSGAELSQLAANLIFDAGARESALAAAEKYLREVYASFGDEAAARLCARIRELVDGPDLHSGRPGAQPGRWTVA